MDRDQKVWRYLGFSRFIWMLQRSQLWLARADKLEDPWELAITGEEIEYLVRRHPISPIGEPPHESALARTKRITELWRTTTFVNCWCAHEYESHALWRVFCGPNEGVAVLSTWEKLERLAENMAVVEVVRTPQLEKVAIRKRHMFEYEHEVRIIAHNDTPNPRLIKGEFGCQLPFEPSTLIDAIIVHPEADDSFYDVVFAAVDTHARDIRDRVEWSSMKEAPPVIAVPE